MNDDRPIEKLLRRYAKERREDAGAPVELHPATRRLLQGEVARQFPKRTTAGDGEPTALVGILIGWRRRLIWGIPVLVVLGVSVWILVGPNKASHEFSLAKNAAAPTGMVEDSFRAIETPSLAGPPAPAASVSGLADATGSEKRPASSVSLKRSGDRIGETLKGEAPARRQRDARAVAELAAASQKEAALNLETDHATAKKSAPIAMFDQSRNQPVVGNDGEMAAVRILTGEEARANAPESPALARADSVESFGIAPKAPGMAAEKAFTTAPSSKPLASSPGSSTRFYRQEAGDVGEREKAQAYSQTFVNRAPVSAYGKMSKAGGAAPVLVNFQVEQTGNQLRVIDGDGSTYLGEMKLLEPVQALAVASVKKEAATLNLTSKEQPADRQRAVATLPKQQEAHSYFACRVAGTNRTLNQQVVFTWNFVELTNGLAAAQVKLPSGGGNVLQNNRLAQQLPLLLNNSVINGRAQLGNAKEIEINAVPVSP